MFRGIGVSFVAASVVVLAGCEHIGGSFETRTSLDVGYQYLSFKGVSYEHDTHPDDTSFLSGSAGETEIDEGQALKAAARLKVGNPAGIEAYGGLGFLLLDARDESRNENETRPSGSESRIYSEVYPFSPLIEAGVRRYLDLGADLKGYGGLAAQYNAFWVEHGWNRFGEDEDAKDETVHSVAFGPELGLQINSATCLSSGYLFNLNGQGVDCLFVNLEIGF